MDSLEDFFSYDDLLIEPLNNAGWHIEKVSWKKKNVNWAEFDVVIVRSTWDYQDDPETFFEVLQIISKQTRLENNLELIQWNINKKYLQDLADQDIAIVPTIWQDGFNNINPEKYFNQLNTERVIFKPLISANADNTFRIDNLSVKSKIDILKNTFENRPFMVQPFMDKIVAEGEYSLFYFGGEYSHSIIKKPQEGDFRVQEEHGGTLELITPGPAILKTAQKVIEVIKPEPLYARVDLVRMENDRFALMELELIEPSLYFNMDPVSPERFVKAFIKWME
jgi:glutathione synthase/RimK-type ligase-like ATP-grasp enzyme